MGLFGSSFRVAQRVAVPDFNLVGSARVELAFGCVQPGNYQFTGFLDDNGNASSTSIQSADYRDSCPPGDLRMTQAITMEAGIARSVTLVLGQTCD